MELWQEMLRQSVDSGKNSSNGSGSTRNWRNS